MNTSRWNRFYDSSPVWAQNLACSVFGLKMRRERYNKVFHDALRFLLVSQGWSYERLLEHQNQELKRIITHAYEAVPYYRKIFNERGLTPEDIQTVIDLQKLPILEKKTLRERFLDLKSKNCTENRLVHGHTGGTTGTALDLIEDVETAPWQWAVWWRHRQRFGLRLNDPFIVFAGRDVVPLNSMDPPFWRRNLPMRQTYVSIHHMTKNNMPFLVDYLQRRNVSYYSGYPSGLYLLASYLLEKGIALRRPPKVTVTGAETLLPHQRRVIETALNTEVADQYGASEHCVNISECENHVYHVDMEFGIVEFVPIPGLPSNVRRIVCTGFKNSAMPLIRYNIGDIATVSDKPCSCGRQSPVVEKIDGRIESYIITPDGRQLGRLDFLFKESKNIEEAQLVQDKLDHVYVKVVKGKTFADSDENELVKKMKQYLGHEIKIDIDYVEAIPRAANGKFRQIVSDVFRDKYAEAIPE